MTQCTEPIPRRCRRCPPTAGRGNPNRPSRRAPLPWPSRRTVAALRHRALWVVGLVRPPRPALTRSRSSQAAVLDARIPALPPPQRPRAPLRPESACCAARTPSARGSSSPSMASSTLEANSFSVSANAMCGRPIAPRAISLTRSKSMGISVIAQPLDHRRAGPRIPLARKERSKPSRKSTKYPRMWTSASPSVLISTAGTMRIPPTASAWSGPPRYRRPCRDRRWQWRQGRVPPPSSA